MYARSGRSLSPPSYKTRPDQPMPDHAAARQSWQSGAAQRGQFGFNNDYAALLPVDGPPDRFLLVTNFEYVTPARVPRPISFAK